MMNTISIKLCFFAALSEALNTREEQIQLPQGSTLNDLKNSLLKRGEKWQAMHNNTILCAINHEMINHNPVLQHQDEVAFFPPVTGG